LTTVDGSPGDIAVKTALLLVGAALGALFKVLMDRYRLRALMPLVLKQMRHSGDRAAGAYSVPEAQQVLGPCEASFKSLSDLIGLGVRPVHHWREGAKLLMEISEIVHSLADMRPDAAIQALEQLRSRGEALNRWLSLPASLATGRG
jgi:hypothetical protein